MPQTGRGSPLMDRLAANVSRLREGAGISQAELATRTRMSADELQQYERGSVGEPQVGKALRLAHSLGTSIDRLTEGVYWDPGEVASSRAGRRPRSERLAGFFLVLPVSVPEFEPAPPRDPVADRAEAAQVFGQNLREARERRHLTQQALAGAAGLSKAGLSLIERGVHETTVDVAFALAGSLQVELAVLLGGISWKPAQPAPPGRGGAQDLPHRNRPTRAVHEAARRRRLPQDQASARKDGLAAPVGDNVDPAKASAADLAARIAANVLLHRHRRGLTQEQLGEAMELERSNVHQIEKGRRLPRISMIVKLAASLNVRCEAITAGITWEPGGAFRVPLHGGDPPSAARQLGENLRGARVQAGLSQQALAGRAAISRGDVVDIEKAKRTVRIFTAVKLAGALNLEVAELFAGTRDWYARPLPPPEWAPEEHRPTKAERDALLTRLWREGCSEREIADALDLDVAAVGPYVRDLRDAGVALAYRRPPRRGAEEAARRRRRARAGRR